MEDTMAYTLQDFVRDTRSVLEAGSSRAVVEKISPHMQELVKNPQFVAQYFGAQQPEGVHKIHVEPNGGFEVMTYLYKKAHKSNPHDHGDSWAIYVQVDEYTDMVEWDRLDDGSDPDHAKLKPRKSYRLNPGNAGVYYGTELHSTQTSDNTRYLRITGTDLENLERIIVDGSGKIVRVRMRTVVA